MIAIIKRKTAINWPVSNRCNKKDGINVRKKREAIEMAGGRETEIRRFRLSLCFMFLYYNRTGGIMIAIIKRKTAINWPKRRYQREKKEGSNRNGGRKRNGKPVL